MILLGLGIQSPLTSSNIKGETTTLTTEERMLRIEEFKEAAQTQREAYKTRLKNIRLTIGEDSEASRDAFRAAIEKERLAFQEEIEIKREEMREEFAAKREAFDERLATIRDEKKKDLVENIQERMTKLNTTRTDAQTRHLTKMSEIIERVTEKTEEQKVGGKDVTSVLTAITAAESAIATAQEAVTTQAGQVYVVTISTESNLKSDVQTVSQTLAADLKAVQDAVGAARKAIRTAIHALEAIQ